MILTVSEILSVLVSIKFKTLATDQGPAKTTKAALALGRPLVSSKLIEKPMVVDGTWRLKMTAHDSKVLTILSIALVTVIGVGALNYKNDQDKASEAKKFVNVLFSEQSRCIEYLPELKKEIQKLNAEYNFETAIMRYDLCFKMLSGDSRWQEVDSMISTFTDRVLTSSTFPNQRDDRGSSERLSNLFPENLNLRKAKEKMILLAKEKDKADMKKLQLEAVNLKKLKKTKGITIGMTRQDVLDSSWGKPRKVNTTIRASGHEEQWVYDSGSYLYFENETLTTIQK